VTVTISTEASEERSLTLRCAIIAVLLLVVATLWARQATLLTLSCQVAMSVPPIPALLGLLLLIGAGKILRRWRTGRAFSRREMLVVYCFLCFAVALGGGGALRQFMPAVISLFYFTTPENGWESFHQYVPHWMAPRDFDSVTAYFEGADTAPVPWAAWLTPLSVWMVFFGALFAGLICAAYYFSEEWTERDRLTFPLVELPLSLTRDHPLRGRIPPLFRDPLMWTGFGIAALFNVLNILHAFNPATPALGLRLQLGGLFSDRPFSAISPLTLYYRPDILGFAFLMPIEIIVSTLIFFLLWKAEAVAALALGYDLPGFPHFASQAGGSFVGMALVLLWAARHGLRELLGAATRGAPQRRARQARMLVIGFIGSTIVALLWWRVAGMDWWLILPYFGLIYLFTITYWRIRCETGLALQWAFPVSQQYQMLLDLFGSKAFIGRGNSFASLTMLSAGRFLSRGYLPLVSAYSVESFRLGTDAGIRRSHLAGVMGAAVILGTLFYVVMQLHTAYFWGQNVLEGGVTRGGQRVGSAIYAFGQLAHFQERPAGPVSGRAWAMAWGLAATVLLSALRHRFLRLPLHPLGFVIGVTRGYRTWGMMIIAGLVKAAALRIGGVRLYRRLIPLFLGIVIGHFVVAGMIWGTLASFGGERVRRAYPVWFG
jgi:hypothetical protein